MSTTASKSVESGKKAKQSRARLDTVIDPITGRKVLPGDAIYLRRKWWGRIALLKYIAEENKDMYPVWPDTGKRISNSDLAELGIESDYIIPSDEEEEFEPIQQKYLGSREIVETGAGHGGFGGGFHEGGGFRESGLGVGAGLGAGLVGGALIGSSLAYGPYGYGGYYGGVPYGYGGYNGGVPYGYGGYYGGVPPVVVAAPGLPRRRVIGAGRDRRRTKEERERDYEHPESVMARLRGHYERRKKNGEFSKTDVRGTGRHPHHKANGEFARSDARHKSGHQQTRTADGEYTVRATNKYWENDYEPRTRLSMLREHLEPYFWHENWHETYDLMPEKDREMVQAEIKRILADCPATGRIDDSVEANRLIEKGFAPYVDYFTGERGILPHDLIRVGGRCVSRHGYILWLEDHRHDELPPRLFERDLIEEDLEPLEVESREYRFLRPRRFEENAAIHTVDKHHDDELRRRARKFKEDYDAGHVKMTRNSLRELPFYEYLDKDEWEDLE